MSPPFDAGSKPAAAISIELRYIFPLFALPVTATNSPRAKHGTQFQVYKNSCGGISELLVIRSFSNCSIIVKFSLSIVV